MMFVLKQSTASQSVLLGPFVDETDGFTAETGLTVANTDIRLSANGGNMAAKNSGGGTHDENGWYAMTLDATDTATVGRLQVSCKVAGARPVWMEFQVLEEVVYVDLFAGGAVGYAAVADLSTEDQMADAVWDEDIIAAHGTADTAGLLLRALGAIISQRTNNATLNALLGVTDTSGLDLSFMVWEEIITAAEHNLTNSAGKKLRQTSNAIAFEGSVDDASATTTSFDIDSAASAVDDFYVDQTLSFIDGDLNGQGRIVLTYTGATRTITFDEALTSAPANGVGIQIAADHVHPVSQITDGMLAAGDIDGFTLEETLKLQLAALAGKASGLATTTATYRSADDTANRIVATVDANGNRSAVTLDAAG